MMIAPPSPQAFDAVRPVRRTISARAMGVPPRALLAALLASACVVAVAVVWWPAVPEAPVAAPAVAAADRSAETVVPAAPAPTVPRRSLVSARLAGVGAAGDLSLPRPTAVPASAALPRLSLDVSSFQRDIQQALASVQHGRAGEAARHIEACRSMDRLGAGMRAALEAGRSRMPVAAYRDAVAQVEQIQVACQAVDAASRAQLAPLLRRSLGEGERGAAASLVVALGPEFQPAAEPEVVTALRHDAQACDLASQGVWNRLSERGTSVVMPDELDALRSVQRSDSIWSRLPPDSAAARAGFESLKQRLGASPAATPIEVAQWVGGVQTRCVDRPWPG